jgi:hypothetical protein
MHDDRSFEEFRPHHRRTHRRRATWTVAGLWMNGRLDREIEEGGIEKARG